MLSESTLVLCGAIASIELLMVKWEQLGKEHPELQYWTQIGLLWVQKYYKWMDDTDAYVIAMSRSFLFDSAVNELLDVNLLSKVLNPSIHLLWIQHEWSSSYIQRSKKIMLDLVSA